MNVKQALLRKEFVLAAAPISFIFIAFSLMTFIPGYPIVLGGFFVCFGIFQSFRSYREANDIFYTVMLPVAKSDVVKAKYKFTVSVQMIAFALMILFASLRMFVIKDGGPYGQNPLMNANAAFLGWVLIIYTVFNVIFVGGFFKTGYKFGIPFWVYSVVGFLVIGFAESLPYFPGMKYLGQSQFDFRQVYVLATGCLLYVVGTITSLNTSVKRFEKIDL